MPQDVFLEDLSLLQLHVRLLYRMQSLEVKGNMMKYAKNR